MNTPKYIQKLQPSCNLVHTCIVFLTCPPSATSESNFNHQLFKMLILISAVIFYQSLRFFNSASDKQLHINKHSRSMYLPYHLGFSIFFFIPNLDQNQICYYNKIKFYQIAKRMFNALTFYKNKKKRLS